MAGLPHRYASPAFGNADAHAPAGADFSTSANGQAIGYGPDSSARWRVLFVALCLAAFAAAAMVYYASLTNNLSVEGDNASYIILAKSLVTGHGYMDIQSPTPQVQAQYPPLFPLLLAPIVALWGTGAVWQMQVLVCTFTLAGFVMAFFLFRRWLDSALLALAVVCVTAASDLVWEFSHKVLTELPYLFFTLVACWWATRYATQDRWRTWSGVFAALATVAAFMTRTIGIALCAGLPLYLLFAPPLSLRGSWWRLRFAKLGFVTAIIGVLAGAWTLRNRLAYNGPSRNYLEQFGLKQTYVPGAGKIGFDPTALLDRMGSAIQYYSSVYLRMLGGHFWDFVPARLGVSQTLLIVTALGFVYAVLRRRTVAEFYIAGYVVIVLLWPWTDLRFAVPVLPFLVYYTALAFLPLMLVLFRAGVIATAATALLIVLLALPTADHTLHTAIHDRRVGYHYEVEQLGEWPAYEDWREFHAAAMWLKQHAVPGATVINRSPNLFYLWTGLKSRNYPYSFDRKYVLSNISADSVDYVLDDTFKWTYTTRIYLDPVIRLYRQYFFGPFRIPGAQDTKVYEVIKP